MTIKKFIFVFLAIFCCLSANAYKVGDYYEKDGLKGIVVRVDASGEHGLIMSLEKCAKKWIDDRSENFSTNAFYEDDGEKNMAVIEKYIKENGKSWSMFPFFEWCRSLGDGWYAPAIDELKDIQKAINGEGDKYNPKFMKKVTKLLKKHKGDGLIDSGVMGSKTPHFMYSSTEADGGAVYALYFKENLASALIGVGGPKGTFTLEVMDKNHTGGKFANVYGSRAVHKF